MTRQITQSEGLSLNRSQCGSCSTEYDSPAGIKVVYSRFRTSTLPSECTGNDKHSCNTSQGSLSGVELAELTSVPRANKTSNGIVAMTRRDSALEAFRHNPTDGSFAPPPYRASTIPNVRTCGSSRTEQDYFRYDESSVG